MGPISYLTPPPPPVAGINAVVFFSVAVFQAAGVASGVAASALVACVNVAGTLVATKALDTAGRKPLLLASFAGMAAASAFATRCPGRHARASLALALPRSTRPADALSRSGCAGGVPHAAAPAVAGAARGRAGGDRHRRVRRRLRNRRRARPVTCAPAPRPHSFPFFF